MSVMKCPHCEGKFEIKPIDAPKSLPDSTPLIPKTIRALLNFMREVGPGRYTVAELYDRYDEDASRPELTKQAFVTGLAMNGATKWRSAVSRGYTIPVIPDEQAPAKPAPTVQAKINADAYMDAKIKHSTDVVVPAPQKVETPEEKAARIERDGQRFLASWSSSAPFRDTTSN